MSDGEIKFWDDKNNVIEEIKKYSSRTSFLNGLELFIKNLIKTNNFYYFLFNLIFIYRNGLYNPRLIYDITSN